MFKLIEFDIFQRGFVKSFLVNSPIIMRIKMGEEGFAFQGIAEDKAALAA